jgi:tRNA(His) guanylyltransferase
MSITKPNQASRDSLGDRMKRSYEDRYRIMIPRRTYTIIRVDGKAFHSYTRGLPRPYSRGLMTCMDIAAESLCSHIQGAEFAYIQSDEISVLLTDFSRPETEAWFDGNLQKIVSVAASVATCAFNRAVVSVLPEKRPDALFDARVFVIPDPVEVENYFIWRQKDAERNSLAMLAQGAASAKQLHGKDAAAQHEILHASGDNWAKHPTGFKRGRCMVASEERGWVVDHEIPVFVEDRDWLKRLIPKVWQDGGIS